VDLLHLHKRDRARSSPRALQEIEDRCGMLLSRYPPLSGDVPLDGGSILTGAYRLDSVAICRSLLVQ
jgi:hypothetical protein